MPDLTDLKEDLQAHTPAAHIPPHPAQLPPPPNPPHPAAAGRRRRPALWVVIWHFTNVGVRWPRHPIRRRGVVGRAAASRSRSPVPHPPPYHMPLSPLLATFAAPAACHPPSLSASRAVPALVARGFDERRGRQDLRVAHRSQASLRAGGPAPPQGEERAALAPSRRTHDERSASATDRSLADTPTRGLRAPPSDPLPPTPTPRKHPSPIHRRRWPPLLPPAAPRRRAPPFPSPSPPPAADAPPLRARSTPPVRCHRRR